MKLAEALLERADLQKDCANLLRRIENNALVQEGDEPAEDPQELLALYEKKIRCLGELIPMINHTNAVTAFSGTEKVADALARRDLLSAQLQAYRNLSQSLQARPDRYRSSEIRYVRCLDVASLQKKIDALSKEYRELDAKLQALNWTVDLVATDTVPKQ